MNYPTTMSRHLSAKWDANAILFVDEDRDAQIILLEIDVDKQPFIDALRRKGIPCHPIRIDSHDVLDKDRAKKKLLELQKEEVVFDFPLHEKTFTRLHESPIFKEIFMRKSKELESPVLLNGQIIRNRIGERAELVSYMLNANRNSALCLFHQPGRQQPYVVCWVDFRSLENGEWLKATYRTKAEDARAVYEQYLSEFGFDATRAKMYADQVYFPKELK